MIYFFVGSHLVYVYLISISDVWHAFGAVDVYVGNSAKVISLTTTTKHSSFFFIFSIVGCCWCSNDFATEITYSHDLNFPISTYNSFFIGMCTTTTDSKINNDGDDE